MPAAAAIDFGTSNSTLALVKDGRVTQLPLDPYNRVTTLMPTLLYFRPGVPPVYGAAAIAAYLEHDLEGRLIQSVKRHLPSMSFDGTAFGRTSVTLEMLIGGFLGRLRGIAEAAAGEPVRHLLLGRPARFAAEEDRDALAEQRLRDAARLAGFEEVAFQLEPIAAARSFERSIDHDVLCFVGDLGGGTSDFTLIRLGPSHRGAIDRSGDVLGVAGLDVAGNDIDARLVWSEVAPHFGAHARYRPDRRMVTVPTMLHHAMTRWHTLCQATTPKNLSLLDRWITTADDKQGLEHLRELIRENYGYLLFQAVESTKIALGASEDARLRFKRGDIDLDLPVARASFEAAIRPDLARISETAHALLDRCGVTPQDVDVAFLTGGTSKLPAVRSMFEGWFPGRIVEQDSFTSVGEGLGVEAAERYR